MLRIRAMRAAGERTVAIAGEFGISDSLVSQIARGKLWREVGGPITCQYMTGMSVWEKIELLTDKSAGPDGCWPFLGRLNDDGYGIVYDEHGESVFVHRFALERSLGKKLPPEIVTRHQCHNRACRNERHLLPGTIAENNADTVRDGRTVNGSHSTSAKLHDVDVLAIRYAASLGRVNYNAVGRQYGVTGNCIKKVVLGRSWRHLLAAQPANTNASLPHPAPPAIGGTP